jgi:predicted dehydrogenase
MSQSSHQILIIGCGSIGDRHIRAFRATGRAALVACDIDRAVADAVAAKYQIAQEADWRAALANSAVTGAVVATPAQLHVQMAREILASGRHVLIEKPLAVELEKTDELITVRDRMQKFAAVAYVRHCAPVFREARDFIRSGQFGEVRHVALTTGEHFPTARPAYREIYYRDHASGGGAIQDALTHMANLVEWIIGPTTRLYCDAGHQTLDGVTVEDTVNVTARNGGAMVSYALNQFQASNELRIDFHGERGSVRIEQQERWGTLAHGEKSWTWHGTKVSRDASFVAQAEAFLDGCEGRANPLCTLEEGIQALRFNLAALQSWREGRPVDLASGSSAAP